MAGRIRTIKPEVLDDEKALDLSDTAWRLWVSSWVLADDAGCFRAGDRYLAAEVWKDTGRRGPAAKARNELARVGLIQLYQVGGETFGRIKPSGWSRHQRIDKPGKPRVPTPESDGAVFVTLNETGELVSVSRKTSGDSREPSRLAYARETSDLRPPTSESDHDHRPPTTDAEPDASGGGESPTQAPLKLETDDPQPKPSSAINRCWARYVEQLAKVLPQKAPHLTAKRRQQIRDRVKTYGLERVLAAVDAFLAPSSWYVREASGKWATPELIFRSDEQLEKVESAGAKDTAGSADLELAWRLWRERYRFIKASAYADGPACVAAMLELVSTIRRHAAERFTAAGGDEQQHFEAALDWVMRAFLASSGQDDFLEKHAHQLRFISRDLPEYGLPWAPGKRQPFRVPSTARMSGHHGGSGGHVGRATDYVSAEMAPNLAAAAARLGINRAEAPSDPLDQPCGKPIAPLLAGIGGLE